MGYFEESKSYELFDQVEKYIIIQHNVIFDEKNFGLDLLKSPYGPSYNDHFGIIEDTRSNVPPMSTSISSLNSIPESTGSGITMTKTITSPNLSSENNGVSLTTCLP